MDRQEPVDFQSLLKRIIDKERCVGIECNAVLRISMYDDADPSKGILIIGHCGGIESVPHLQYVCVNNHVVRLSDADQYFKTWRGAKTNKVPQKVDWEFDPARVPTKKEIREVLLDMHREHGLDVSFGHLTLAKNLECDPACLFNADTETGPLYEMMQNGEVGGNYKGEHWCLKGISIESDW